MLVFIAATIVILFVAAAFAVDVAHIHMVRAELRTATDAAARAGAEALGRLQNKQAAIDAAIAIGGENLVFGKALIIDRSDVAVGRNDPNGSGGFSFVADGTPFNAVRVFGKRVKGSPSGPVPLMFAPLFGVTNFEPIQVATAGRLDRDIALVLDVSGSMAQFGRFQSLNNALNVFLAQLQQTKQDEFVSLTVYATTPTKLHELTPDLAAIRSAFGNSSPNGFTGIGRALQVGIDSVLHDPQARSLVSKSVIIMTDGNQNTGIDPMQVVPSAVAQNVVVHTITFTPAPINR